MIVVEIWAEAAFHSFSEIRCPEGHLLIRPHIIHVVRTYSKVPIKLERPLFREEMRYRENEAKSSIFLEQLLEDEDKS